MLLNVELRLTSLILSLLALISTAKSHHLSSPCSGSDKKCSYRISRTDEAEYLMVKNIMENMINNHWNITLEYLNYYLESDSRICDQYFEYKAVNQVILKDFRHPNALFKKMPEDKINQTIKLQYEIEWYEKYKLIKYNLQSKKYLKECNNLGLKIYYLMYDYVKEQPFIFKCSSKLYMEEPVTKLIDYYISQTFLKNCYGNLELLANSIYRLFKYDCQRSHTFKLAYFNSKFLNQFRACNPNLTVNDLELSGKFSNCTHNLNGFVNKKFCHWFEIVCKYPTTCLKSSKTMKWNED